MPDILDRDGKVLYHSKNLRAIRRYVGKHIIKVLSIDELSGGEGKLSILFEDGSSYEHNWESFNVLCEFVQRWRNVHGSPLMVNGFRQGKVSKNNPTLS